MSTTNSRQQYQLTHRVGDAVAVLRAPSRNSEATDPPGRELLTYHYGAHSGAHNSASDRFPYIYPLNLLDGPSVALHRPFDHDWHLGLFFAWKYLNGINVWEGVDSGEPHGHAQHLRIYPYVLSEQIVGWRHELAWISVDGTDLLHETRVVLVHPSTIPNAYCVDWIASFTTPAQAVVLARKAEWGGYAGLSVRLPRSFAHCQVRNAVGESDVAATHRGRAAWTDYSGWIDGQGRQAWGGVAMIDHPANPRHPSPWLTYNEPDFQFLNAAFVRDEEYTLAPDASLTLAYRVVVHWDVGDPAQLDAEAAAFRAVDPQALLTLET